MLRDYASEGEDRTPEIELDSPEQRLSAVTQALSEAIRVRELLAERDDGIEAREYREWVFAAARAATRATKSGGIAGFGRKLVSDDEARYLEHAAVALGLEPVEAE